MRIWLIILMAVALGGPVQALDLKLPGTATLAGEVLRDHDTYDLPIGPFADGQIEVRQVEGQVLQQAWWIDQPGTTTLQLIRPLRNALIEAGYTFLYKCGGQQCGGFDFRFNTRVMPAPDMYIDLFDFRYLAAVKGDQAAGDDVEYLSLIVSRSSSAGYVQIIHVTTGDGAALNVEQEATQTAPQIPLNDQNAPAVISSLTGQGHVILADLDFETGSSALGKGPFASLGALAGFLNADTSRRIVLVGHTDAVGALENNIALSKRRAASVLERLVSDYGVARGQLQSDGTGYLSPIGPNLTAEGRETNRRVEAVLLNTN